MSEEALARFKSQMEAMASKAIHAVPANQPAFSKLGGLPDLPEGTQWPSWQNRSLAFLGQIDLAEVAKTNVKSCLPASGALYFFYDQDQGTWGFDPKDLGSWRVLYFEGDAKTLRPAAKPSDLAGNSIYTEKRLEFRVIKSVPNWERLDVDPKVLTDREFDEIVESGLEVYEELACHQLLGFPNNVQGDNMELECELASNGLYCGDESGFNDPKAKELKPRAADWRLLFQLDSDDDAGMMWGDMGMLYFWIRESDALHGDFSKVWMILQCG